MSNDYKNSLFNSSYIRESAFPDIIINNGDKNDIIHNSSSSPDIIIN